MPRASSSASTMSSQQDPEAASALLGDDVDRLQLRDLVADLPGVAPEHITVRLDGDEDVADELAAPADEEQKGFRASEAVLVEVLPAPPRRLVVDVRRGLRIRLLTDAVQAEPQRAQVRHVVDAAECDGHAVGGGGGHLPDGSGDPAPIDPQMQSKSA